MNTNPLTPAAAEWQRRRAEKAAKVAIVATISCGCTDPERVGDGKTTRVFKDNVATDLCRGCGMDRLREHYTPAWAPRNAQADLARKDFARGTEAIK